MPRPTTPTPPAETGFDLLVFWFHHQKKILIGVGLIVVAVVVYGISEYVRMSHAAAAQAALANAHSVEDYRKVVAEFGGTASGGDAYLLMAQKLRAEGKLDESSVALHTFIDKYPEHPMISGAWTSLAANLEAQGKVDEALATYQKVSTSFANSFSAPLALMAQARILAQKGRTEDARRLYEQVITQYPGNIAAQQASQEVRNLKKPETSPTKSEAAPAKPEAAPAKPEATPAKPEAAPAKPEATPAKPEATPAKPEATPVKPDANPPSGGS